MKPPAPVKVGQRIELLSMPDDPNPVPAGSQGEITFVSYLPAPFNEWQIGVNWDNGRSLMLIYPHDKFMVL